jgi:hypothetical protein
MIPGDNPAAIGGVPVTIQWEPVEEQLFAVDEFEASRSTPRSMIEMRMPPSYRSDLLRRLGFSRGDVTAALKAANIVRAQRRRTAETLNFSVVQESLEKVKRATLNVTLRRGKKVQEKSYWQHSVEAMLPMHRMTAKKTTCRWAWISAEQVPPQQL